MIKLTKQEPDEIDLLTARFTARKVEKLVQAAYDAYQKAAQEFGLMSIDDAFGVAFLFAMNVLVRPAETMANDPKKVRKEIARQFRTVIEEAEVIQ